MNIAKLLGGLAASVMLAGGASAQVVGIGTNPEGSLTYTVGATVGRVMATEGGLSPRIQPFGGNSQWVPLINRGELEFGLMGAVEAHDAWEGAELYKARPQTNVLVAAVLGPLPFAFFVRDSSPARTVYDSKGMRLPTEFPNAQATVPVIVGYLATHGLTLADYKHVPVSNLGRAASEFEAGKVDIGVAPIGSGVLSQINVAVGGLRYLSIDTSPAAQARMKAALPVVYPLVFPPAPHLVGIKEPITSMAYDMTFSVGRHVPEETVYKAVKAVYENQPALGEALGRFKNFKPEEEMAKQLPIPYHPGAMKFYTEKGVWPPKG
jgi:TRAP transporter TAXI family solute receptor